MGKGRIEEGKMNGRRKLNWRALEIGRSGEIPDPFWR